MNIYLHEVRMSVSTVRSYLDAFGLADRVREFDVAYPAAGSASSAVALSCDELFEASRAVSWETLCQPRDAQNA